VPEGAECSTPISTQDWHPTLVALAGAAVTPDAVPDGVSLAGLLKNPAAPLARETLYWHLPHYHHSTPASAIRRGDWKLIEFFEDGVRELYDLRADPAETTNLAARETARADELHGALVVWRKRVSARMPEPNPNHDPARATELAKGGGREKPPQR
jgi:arylsulfatase A